jgi:uncharacterized protein (TIGR02466 family)
MHLNPIFSVCVGVDDLSEHLASAREVFIENKKMFKPSVLDSGVRTTLEHYVYPQTHYHKESKKLDIVKEAILLKASDFVKTCGYKADAYQCVFSNIWLNEMEKHSSHKPHYHYGANISGCFYIDIPDNTSQIVFSHNYLAVDTLNIFGVDTYTPANASNWGFVPKEGEVFFWKSDVQHEVPPTDFEGVRRSIAFDIIVSR